MIPDPSCIAAEEAKQKYGVDSYGLDVCPGDLGEGGLLKAVGDPTKTTRGVWINDLAIREVGDPLMHFGTSAGAVGFRKFPNPKFNKAKWDQMGGWQKYTAIRDAQGKVTSSGVLSDSSIEPPFLIGHACGSCHVSFNPENPPQDVEHPTWANIKGAVGAQYLQVPKVIGSGMPATSLEWQAFTMHRPGSTDTSAVRGIAKYLRSQAYLECGSHQNDSGSDNDFEGIVEDQGHDTFLRFDANKTADNLYDGKINQKEFDGLVAFLKTI